MERYLLLMLVAGLCFLGCDSREAKPKAPAKSSTAGGNPLTAPADYLGAVGKAQKTAVRTVDTAGLKKTIQMFYAQEGRYPKSLQELVSPDYLASLPPPPAGMRFDYNPQTGDVKVVPK